MATFIFANNIDTTLAGGISSASTSLTLSSTQNLPSSIPAGTYLVLTLNDQATRTIYEIVYVTAISGATLTVLRGQEGTAAKAWLTGDYAFSGPTAGQMASFMQGTSTGVTPGTYGNSTTVPQITVNAQGLVSSVTNVPIAFPITSFNGRAGAIVLNSGDVTTALGFNPVNKAGDTMTGTLAGTSATFTGTVTAQSAGAGGAAIYVGNDAALWDINAANTLGIYGQSNSAVGGIKLGSSGPLMSGSSTELLIDKTIHSNGQINSDNTMSCVQGLVTMETASGNQQGLLISSSGSNAFNSVYLGFQNVSKFAAYFGIGADNNFRVGGWSMGATSYRVVTEGLAAVTFAGSITCTTMNATSSDIRLKENVVGFEPRPLHRLLSNASERYVKAAGPLIAFDWKDHDLGSGKSPIAQAVRDIEPLYVTTFRKQTTPEGVVDDTDYLAVDKAAVALEQAMWAGGAIDRLLSRVGELEDTVYGRDG
jgi:hypothetical protein